MNNPLSIVVLTRNRLPIVRPLLESLEKLRKGGIEIIVVDNASVDGTSEIVLKSFPRISVVTLDSNRGAVARNEGLAKASGDVIVTLDDDVYGLTEEHLDRIENYFEEKPRLGALNFKVLDEKTKSISNWCHPYKPEDYSGRYFETCEISEGAVAFRRGALDETGYYPEPFFISNEGADLACRLLNRNFDIGFAPDVEVQHKHAEESREPWRRYYYDTRNHFWLAVRNFRLAYGLRYVLAKVGIMMIYSIRDGYFRYWFRGVIDALRGLGPMIRSRSPMTDSAVRRRSAIRSNRPGFLYLLKRRLQERKIRI